MSKRIKQNMASGKSESNAWVNAKFIEWLSDHFA